MKKKLIILSIFILIIFLVFFISKNMIKKSKNGNDISSQKIVDNILNINRYKAKIEVQVSSNKNKNKYIMLQEHGMGNGTFQEIIEPENLKGIKITKKENTLILENTELNLKKIYENYEEMENNDLDLNVFLEEYKKNDKSFFEEKDGRIVMHCENKLLYINKEKNIPERLIIKDNNRNKKIDIKYTNIELN